MAYQKTNWQDTLRDAKGNIIQKGTPLNAQALGKIEDGIVQTEQKIDTEIEKVTTQLADIVINVKTFDVKGDGIADDTNGIQNAVDFAGAGGKVYFPKGTYLVTSPISIKSKMEIFGTKDTVILNGFDRTTYPRGVTQGIFQGNHTNSGGYTGEASIGTVVSTNGYNVTVDTIPTLVKNDIIRFDSHIALVESVNGSVITCDRTIVDMPTPGTTVYKLTSPLKNLYIHDIMFDFNGSIESPRYGYGILLNGAYDSKIERVRGKNVGSKVVQFSHSLDCFVEDVFCDSGTDNYGTGGHSYVIRLSQCDNIKMTKIGGKRVRHVIDLSNAHRNKGVECYGEKNVTDFMSHFNSCKYNEFINCDSTKPETAAYSFTPTSGDQYNSIVGGTVNGSFMIGDQILDKTINIEGVLFRNSQGSLLGEATFKGCIFEFSVGQANAFMRNASGSFVVTFLNCEFKIFSDAIANALLYSTGTADVKALFNTCKFTIDKASGGVILGNNKTEIRFLSCETNVSVTQTANTPFFVTDNLLEAKNSVFKFNTSGFSFFGILNVNVLGRLTLDKNTFINASQIYRNYVNSVTASMIELGNNDLINSSYVATTITYKTIGIVDTKNLPSPPTSGKWLKGSLILNKDAIAAGYTGFVAVSDGLVWKGFGLIEA